MKHLIAAILLSAVFVLAGCATSSNVLLATLNPPKSLNTAALVPQDGNSLEMDSYLQKELQAHGVSTKAPLPAGTRKWPDVDLIVGYTDVWRWDLAMYLRSLDINIFDAQSGNLIVTGR